MSGFSSGFSNGFGETLQVNVWSSLGSTDGNLAANWSLGIVPTIGDIAILDATSAVNCILSVALKCKELIIKPTYAGVFNANGKIIELDAMFAYSQSSAQCSMSI